MPVRQHRRIAALATAIVAALALAACGTSGSETSGGADDYPSERLTWIVPFGAGGGNDILARTVASILEEEEIYPGTITIVNIEGGSGANGWSEFQKHAGDPYYISSTSASIITTPLLADTSFGPTSFTPVGLIGTDNLLLLSAGDIKSLDDLIELADTREITIGGQSAVSLDYIVPQLVAEQAGFEFTYVPFEDPSTLQNSLLSGSVDAIVSNPGEVLGLVKDGKYNALFFSGPERLTELPDVPTVEELGYPVGLGAPRGVILPPDVDPSVQEWWIEAMQQVVETDAWQAYLEENVISAQTIWGDEFNEYLGTLQVEFETALESQG